jgi:hypothetical protein
MLTAAISIKNLKSPNRGFLNPDFFQESVGFEKVLKNQLDSSFP